MMFVSEYELIAFFHRFFLSRLPGKKAVLPLLYPGFVYNGDIFQLTGG
jgi:hypothetical protein